jgi:hypothetical protein
VAPQLFVRGRRVISTLWKMSQMNKEQKHTNDYFYPGTECNQYSMEKITDGPRTETRQ